MVEGIGRNIAGAFAALIVVALVAGAALVGLIWGIVWYFSSNEIIVDKPLEPIRYELVVREGNVIDTVYIYEKH